jgi:sec-independent protein translocase protein TatA
MFGLGLPEMIIITVVGIAIFGAKRIPELGKAVGQSLKGFRQELNAPEPPTVAKAPTDSPESDR